MFGAVAALATPASSLAQDGPVPFGPASEWAIDYGDDYCRLARTFEGGGRQLTLAMERIQPGPTVRLLLSGDGLEAERRAAMIGYRLSPEADKRESRILRADSKGGSVFNLGTVYMAPAAQSRTREEQRALRGRYSRSQERAFGGQVDAILVESGVVQPIRLETGSLADPLQALQVCADELVAYWGLDAARHGQMRRPVTPANDMAGWLPAGTIGQRDLGLLAGGQNAVRLMVDAQGKATDCTVHFASLPADTNQKVCSALLANARFEPARDAADQPMDSYWVTELTFLAMAR